MKNFIFFLLIIFTFSQSAEAAISFVNSSGGGTSGSATTVATAALSTTTGNLIVIASSWSSTAATISGITDTAGNTYIQCTGSYVQNSVASDMWYAKNITGNASNVVTVTFTPGNTATFSGITQLQYSGANTVSPFELGTNGTATAATSVTSSSFSPASSGNVNVATANGNGGSTYSAGTNYVTASSANHYVEHRIGAPSGSQTASVSSSSGLNLVISVASFKASNTSSPNNTFFGDVALNGNGTVIE